MKKFLMIPLVMLPFMSMAGITSRIKAHIPREVKSLASSTYHSLYSGYKNGTKTDKSVLVDKLYSYYLMATSDPRVDKKVRSEIKSRYGTTMSDSEWEGFKTYALRYCVEVVHDVTGRILDTK